MGIVILFIPFYKHLDITYKTGKYIYFESVVGHDSKIFTEAYAYCNHIELRGREQYPGRFKSQRNLPMINKQHENNIEHNRHNHY